MLHRRLSPGTRASLFYLAFYFAMASYLPFMNVYFHSLGLSGWQIGVLSALLPTMSFLIVPPLAMLADRRRWRVRLLCAGVLGTTLSLSLLMLPARFVGLLPLMALLAVCYSPLVPLADTSIVGMAARQGLNYGGMRLFGSLGFALSAAMFGAVWQYAGYRAMFAVGAGLSLVVAYLALGLDEAEPTERRHRTPLRSIAQDRLLVGVLVTTFLAASAIGMEFTFVGIYMSKLGGSGLLVGLIFAVAAMFELPSMRYSGAVAARIGPGETLLLAYGLLVLAYLGYAAAPSPYVLLACSILRGLGYGLFYVGTIRFLNERAPSEWSATVQGIMNATAYGLGQLITRPLGGRIFDAFGPRVLYLLCSLMVALAAAIMALMVRLGRSSRTPSLQVIASHGGRGNGRRERRRADRS
jgi:MFS transporter, PPP family, 3-phenylpropionic acid transporter